MINKNNTLLQNPNVNIDYSTKDLKEIWLAGGCFWGVEAYMARIQGVADVTVGYANGRTENPTYEEVCRKNTGYAEAVHVKYDPEKILLEELLKEFFEIIDPTTLNRQGNDIGSQYRTGIFYKDKSDEQTIRNFIANEQKRFSKRIVTEVLPLTNYYLAEEYHQDYLEKNPGGYCHIDFSALDARNAELANKPDQSVNKNDKPRYVKPDQDILKKALTPLQFEVTQNNRTEPPFNNEYWNNHEPGLYVDIVSGEPLFSSKDKFDSGCGWPSFTKPVNETEISNHQDKTFGMVRTEVRSTAADSHLGHVFDDGPREQGGRRFCINSAAIRFIPKRDMEKEGYGQYLKLI